MLQPFKFAQVYLYILIFNVQEGFYCKLGTVEPIPCIFNSLCPAGTVYMNRWPIFLLILVLLILIYIGHLINTLLISDLKRMVHKLENAQQIMSTVPIELKSHSQIDIKLNNIGLKINGHDILDNINAEFKCGRMTAIMGPSYVYCFISLLIS